MLYIYVRIGLIIECSVSLSLTNTSRALTVKVYAFFGVLFFHSLKTYEVYSSDAYKASTFNLFFRVATIDR